MNNKNNNDKKYTEKQIKEALSIDLNNPDDVTQFLLSFLEKHPFKTDKELVDLLTKYKPLKTVIDIQNQYQK